MTKRLGSPGLNLSYRFAGSLLLLSFVSIALLVARIAESESFRYSFLVWNLILAAVPVPLAWYTAGRIRQFGWMKWQQILLTLIWIAFLPNSFYLLTDLIHLRANYEADLLFDITLLVSFLVTGLVLGFTSVYFMHKELVKRLREIPTYAVVSVLFLAVSFAVCLGRYTRWNTWDIILRPAGLLFDVSDKVINPTIHMQTYETTVTLFLLLFSSYIVVWEAVRYVRQTQD